MLYQSEIQVDKKQTEDNVIQGTIHVKKDGWFITSIPYDKHFKIYIDGKETEIQKVNTAFLGCKIESGNHLSCTGNNNRKSIVTDWNSRIRVSACTGKKKTKNNTR